MSVSIAHYLKDFGDGQPQPSPFPDSGFAGGLLDEPAADFSATPALDIEEERRIAYAEGHEAATRELSERMQTERDELLAAHAAELASIAQKHADETTALIVERLRDSADLIAKTIGDQVAEVLAPILTRELSDAAAVNLAEMIRAAVPDGEAVTLVVKGSRDLYESLKAQLGDEDKTLRFEETADIDLTVEIGESVLVTRMSAWASSLRKVLK
jgi:hypothetical protein